MEFASFWLSVAGGDPVLSARSRLCLRQLLQQVQERRWPLGCTFSPLGHLILTQTKCLESGIRVAEPAASPPTAASSRAGPFLFGVKASSGSFARGLSATIIFLTDRHTNGIFKITRLTSFLILRKKKKEPFLLFHGGVSLKRAAVYAHLAPWSRHHSSVLIAFLPYWLIIPMLSFLHPLIF